MESNVKVWTFGFMDCDDSVSLTLIANVSVFKKVIKQFTCYGLVFMAYDFNDECVFRITIPHVFISWQDILKVHDSIIEGCLKIPRVYSDNVKFIYTINGNALHVIQFDLIESIKTV